MESVLLLAERLYPTKNDLPAPVRRQLITLLNQHLADAVDLQTQAKTAHWNVKGTEISRGIDKWLWFVEAHVQAEMA